MGNCLEVLQGSHTTVENNVRNRRLSTTIDINDDLALVDSKPGDCAVVTRAGIEDRRIKINQDAFFLDKERFLYAVFDGHGKFGHLCSQYFRTHLPVAFEAVKENLSPENISSALLQVADALDLDDSIDTKFSGLVATVCCVQEERIISAWVGDSRAILRSAHSTVALTTDHKPEVLAERKRILRAGGKVKQLKDTDGTPLGGLRVFVPSSTIPGVNFTRSFGDAVIHKYGVCSVVECIVKPRLPEDKFIVVASDGVFEMLSNQEVSSLVASSSTVAEAAEKLVHSSHQKWLNVEHGCADDITSIVIYVGMAG